MGIRILKTSSYLPGAGVDNFYFEDFLETSDSWISSRTGIKNRYFAKDEDLFDLVERSVKNLNLSQKEMNRIKTIIVATCTSSYAIPNLASRVQENFNFAEDIYSLDINMACSSFVAGLKLINGLIKEGEYALLIGAEIFSEIIDFKDRNTAVLFGDGAGAVLLGYGSSESFFLSGTRGNTEVLNCGHESKFLHMNGKEVYRFGVSTMEKVTKSFMDKIDINTDKVDYFIAHQANIRILESLAKGLGVSMDKFPFNLDRVGNISSASIPVLLDHMNREGKLKSGDKIIFLGFGAGLTWSLAYMEW